MGTISRALLAAAVAVTLLALPAAAPAQLLPPLGGLLPPLPGTYHPSNFSECPDGAPTCVDATLAELQSRLDALGCDHNAVFAQAYLVSTQKYKEVAGDFDDPAWVAHEDAAFAGLYLRAYDDWKAGRPVPQAWQIAFDAAASRAVSGLGDLALGANAHINRDLPFLLAGVGLYAPDGSSHKPDHVRTEGFLGAATEPTFQAIAERYDPTVADNSLPEPLNSTVFATQTSLMREIAWRHAELLEAAPTAAARELVASMIEEYAATQAILFRAQFGYAPPLTTTEARDAFCAAHVGDG